MKAICLTPNGLRCVPDSATITRRNPWFVPADGTPGEWRVSIYYGAVISRLGMCIRAKFAHRYYNRLVVAAATSNPGADPYVAWMRDGALTVGDVDIDKEQAPTALTLSFMPEQEVKLPSNEDIDSAIEAVSQYVTLKTGDLVLLPLDAEYVLPAPPCDVTAQVCDGDNPCRVLLFKAR